MNNKSRYHASAVHIRLLTDLKRQMMAQVGGSDPFVEVLLSENIKLLDQLIVLACTRQALLKREVVGDKG